jgi:hypothetical protein
MYAVMMDVKSHSAIPALTKCPFMIKKFRDNAIYPQNDATMGIMNDKKACKKKGRTNEIAPIKNIALPAIKAI